MFMRIDHVALHVAELDRSVAFYATHFGFEKYFEHISSRGGRIAYLKLGDTVLELVDHGEEEVIEFTAPTEPGIYPYICTFPGHALLMRGMMHVLPKGGAKKQ